MIKGAGWLYHADTLIRAVLHLSPDELTDEEWVHQVHMAEWFLFTFRAPGAIGL